MSEPGSPGRKRKRRTAQGEDEPKVKRSEKVKEETTGESTARRSKRDVRASEGIKSDANDSNPKIRKKKKTERLGNSVVLDEPDAISTTQIPTNPRSDEDNGRVGTRGDTGGDNQIREDEVEARHNTIFTKFRKAVKAGAEKQQPKGTIDQNEKLIELRDLVPIPLPQQPADVEAVPTFSALPSWLSQPVRVSAQAAMPFSKLGVDADTTEQLSVKGFKEALAVQTAVLPLLLPIPGQHPGDLCVSAATGSGKTLSYVLPMVQDLKGFASTYLRAIIVVPTRELVSQVQDVAKICVSGTGLQVGTAVGYHTLKSEQETLVRPGRRYDPMGYARLKRKVDKVVSWQDPNSEIEINSIDEDEMESQEDIAEVLDMLPGYVPDYTSKVDILICTPGRLVEHLRTTKGFSLQHLRWLVIDEADRLLDQSFQEWANTLNKALDAASFQRQSQYANTPFPYSLLDQLQNRVRKVILSATMTRDLDKLGSLRLWNPKLVLVEGNEGVASADGVDTTVDSAQGMGMLTLPPTLKEHALPVGDGSEKPLYLLQLLLECMSFGIEKPNNSTVLSGTDMLVKTTPSLSDSSSESSSSDDDDDDDDDSDSSSDSNPDSESTSSQSSSDESTTTDDDDEDDSSSDDSISSSSSVSSTSAASHIQPTARAEDVGSESQTPSGHSNVLIFTSSTESATRLTHLLATLYPSLLPLTANLTKSTSTSSTRRILSQFQSGILRVLIATDRASRGLDLPGLAHVVNYDVPRSLTSYLHRVGRTARAGNAGKAWTLVDEREARWFWNSIARTEEIDRLGRKVVRSRVDVDGGEAFQPAMKVRYAGALETLKKDVQGRGAVAAA